MCKSPTPVTASPLRNCHACSTVFTRSRKASARWATVLAWAWQLSSAYWNCMLCRLVYPVRCAPAPVSIFGCRFGYETDGATSQRLQSAKLRYFQGRVLTCGISWIGRLTPYPKKIQRSDMLHSCRLLVDQKCGVLLVSGRLTFGVIRLRVARPDHFVVLLT